MDDFHDRETPDPANPLREYGEDRPFRVPRAAGSHEPEIADAFGASAASGQALFEWRDTFRILRRRRWPALTVMLLAIVLAVLQAATRVPTYEAKVRLVIEPQQANVTGLKDPIDEERSSEADFQTQFTILQSRSLARRTMQVLNIWDRQVRPATTDTARPATGSFAALIASGRDAVAWIYSGAWMRPEPPSAARAQESAEETAKINAFMGGARVVGFGGSRIVDVYYTSTDPLLAAKYANTLVEQFIQQNLELRFVASKEVADWLSDRLVEQRRTLEASEQALQAYRESHAGSLADESSLTVQKLTDLTTAYTKAKTERIEKEVLFNQLQVMQRDHAPVESFPALQGNSIIQQQRADLIALQQQQGQLSAKLGDRHPSLIKVREAVQAAEGRLQTETAKLVESVRRDYLAARDTESSLGELLDAQKRQTLDAQKRQTLTANRSDINLTVLQRDAESNRSIYQSLLQRYNEFGVTRERRVSSNIRIVDPAEVPQVALATAAKRDLQYGVFGGLFLAIGLAFFLEYLDRNVKTPEQIKTDLALPFLGLVPLVTGDHAHGTRLVSDSPAPSFGEAFRTLRTNVKLSIATDSTRSVLVTSACPSDGKTLVASNLAVVLALTDQRVILIDADLRRPRLHKVFGCPAEPGLSNLLVGDGLTAEVHTTAIPGLHVLTSGTLPPNPSELLDSKRFRSFIAKLGKRYDWVVIDSPPALPVTDAIVLGEMAAAVVLVVAADQTPLYSARAAIEHLQNARAHVIGAVLNRADLKRRAYYYERYYRHEYDQYYKESASPA